MQSSFMTTARRFVLLATTGIAHTCSPYFVRVADDRPAVFLTCSGPQRGVVPLSALATRKRLRRLCEKNGAESPIALLRDALQRSEVLESVEGGVRRREPLPPPRRMVCSGHEPGAARLRGPGSGGAGESFSCLSYNILADHLATPRMFPHASNQVTGVSCPPTSPRTNPEPTPEVLAWERRSAQLMRELGYHHADVCFLQEVPTMSCVHCACYISWLYRLTIA